MWTKLVSHKWLLNPRDKANKTFSKLFYGLLYFYNQPSFSTNKDISSRPFYSSSHYHKKQQGNSSRLLSSNYQTFSRINSLRISFLNNHAVFYRIFSNNKFIYSIHVVNELEFHTLFSKTFFQRTFSFILLNFPLNVKYLSILVYHLT